MPTVSVELQAFAQPHQDQGEVTGNAEPPTADGYWVWARCWCGERWVTEGLAVEDLLRSPLLTEPN